MNINISQIVENFLSEYQKSDKNFTLLLKLLIDSLEMPNFSNISMSPLNFSNKMSNIKDLDKLSDSDVLLFFKSLLPFKDETILDEISKIVPLNKIMYLLKSLYEINGTKAYLEFWNNIVGEILYNTIDKTSDINIDKMKFLNIMTSENIIQDSIINDNKFSNLLYTDNIEDIKFRDENTFMTFLSEIKNINLIFLILSSLNSNVSYEYENKSNYTYLIEDVCDTSLYCNDLYLPFIRNVKELSNKDIINNTRTKLNNFYTFDDVAHVKFSDIKNMGEIKVFEYESDDDYLFKQISERKIPHINYNLGVQDIFENEVFSPNDDDIYSLHVQPLTLNNIMELDFAVITVIAVDSYIVCDGNNIITT